MKDTKESIKIAVERVLILLKWMIFAGITGAVLGVVGAYFARSIGVYHNKNSTHQC